jgi:hypothetical protein
MPATPTTTKVKAEEIVDTVTTASGFIVPVVAYGGGPIEFAEDRDVWERQPKEPNKGWEIFQLYRDMPPGIRSFQRAYREIHPKTDYRHNYQAGVWTFRWRWRERAAAHDIYMDRKHLATLEADRLTAMREATVVGRALRKKALEAATVLQATIYEEIIDLQTGETTYRLRAALNTSEIVKLAQVGVALEREALGLDVGGRGRGTQVNVAIGVQTLNLESDQALQNKATEILEARKLQALVVEGSYEEVNGGADANANPDAKLATPTTEQ